MTIREVYNLFFEDPDVDSPRSKSEAYKKYDTMLKDQVFTPILNHAGMSWDKPVENKLTGEVGRLELGYYNLLTDYLIFRPYGKDNTFSDRYKVVSRSTKSDVISAVLERDYQVCDASFV